MADNLNEFNADLSKFGEAVEKAPCLLLRKIAVGILKRVKEMTPVKIGRAKGNWFPSVGEPSSEINLDARGDNGKRFPAKVPDFPVLWITNNLPYINKLNAGSSTQAPANFVEIAVESELSVLK